jgi:D-alanyl-D-alanine endopeptidase (penicillin-binding protein 7)
MPVGSLVKVTNTENNAAVIIKIVSKWGQPAGRVVDLSYPAFTALHSSNSGLMRVTVEPAASGAAMGPVGGSTPAPSTTETLPTFTMTDDGVAAPTVQASGYLVLDQNTGAVLASKNADTVRPIASITKLMTGMVFLDQKRNLNSVVTYSSKDTAECSCLRVSPGETMKLSDVINVMFVGSANNAAKMLARNSGLTMTQFVAAMNKKAKAIGLTKTSFVEPSGLSEKNVSTPSELAQMAAYAFHNYPEIRSMTTKKSYVFSTINTKKKHTITLRYSLVGTASVQGMTVTGTKTGFTYEAGQTYAFRAKNAQGVQVVVTILNSPSVARRNADVAALLKWAFAHHTWK